MKKYFSPDADLLHVAQTADIITVSYNEYKLGDGPLGDIGSGGDVTPYKG